MSELERIVQRTEQVTAELQLAVANAQRCQGALQVLGFMKDEAIAAAKAEYEAQHPAAPTTSEPAAPAA